MGFKRHDPRANPDHRPQSVPQVGTDVEAQIPGSNELRVQSLQLRVPPRQPIVD
jgi:hypothetical protein